MKLKYPMLIFYVFLVLTSAIVYLYMNMSQLKETNQALLLEKDSLTSVKNSIQKKSQELEPSNEFRYLK